MLMLRTDRPRPDSDRAANTSPGPSRAKSRRKCSVVDDDERHATDPYILYRNRIGQSPHHPGNAVNGVAPGPPRPGVRATFMTQQTIAKYPTSAASSTTPGPPKRCTASA